MADTPHIGPIIYWSATQVEAVANIEASARKIHDLRGAYGIDVRFCIARHDDGKEFDAASVSLTRPDGLRRWLCLVMLAGAGISALEAALRQVAAETAGMRKAAA